MTRVRGRRQGGFFILDLAFGLALMGVLLGILAAANTQNRRATLTLAGERAALRQAEAALIDLRLGRPPGDAAVEPIAVEGAPDGWRWVRVTVTHERGEVALDGLVPEVTP